LRDTAIGVVRFRPQVRKQDRLAEFFAPLPGSIGTSTDDSFFMRRKVHCSAAAAISGHVFPDGPPLVSVAASTAWR
jgi:hypothetical protein